MTRQFFGTDGIRGRVGDAVINSDWMYQLGWAIGRTLDPRSNRLVFIGRDTRASGQMLESALQKGLLAAGATVSLLGILPTPAVAYVTRSFQAQAGIMISASHNPYDDNGIKIFDCHGMKLSDEKELAIEAMLANPSIPDIECSPASEVDHKATAAYHAFCQAIFPKALSLSGVKLVIDAAHGAAFEIAPTIFCALGAEVILIGATPNGMNINDACGSLHTEMLQQQVLQHQADIGIAFDGDADRLLLVDALGELVDGDEMLGILAQYIKRDTAGVVGTVMSNLGLEQALQRCQVPFERAPVGDRYVLERLLEKQWTLGGEPSGHIIDLNLTTTGDGIVAALQILRVMLEQDQPLHVLKRSITKRPQLLHNIRFSKPNCLVNHPEVLALVKQLTAQFSDRGRILLRMSGTEPLIRVMAEGNDLAEVRSVVDALVELIQRLVLQNE